MNDADYIATLEAELTEVNSILRTLCDKMPNATDEQIIKRFKEQFPEVCQRNREPLLEYGLVNRILEERGKRETAGQ